MNVAEQVYRYFRARGLSPAGAAGVVGNSTQESSNRPDAAGGGLLQDIGSRAPSGTGSLRHQLDSAWRELQGYPGLLKELRGARDPAAAARAFSEQFERPGTPMLGNRERYAREAHSRYGGLSGALPGAGAQAGPAQQSIVQGAAGGSGAALAELVAALQKQSSQPPAHLGSIARPAFAAGQPLPGVAPAEPHDESLMRLAAAAQAEAAAPGEPTVISHHEVAGEVGPGEARPGQYVNPFPGFHKGRVDQGVDYSATPGTPIRAVGDAKILGISPNWFEGQPYLAYQLLSGPRQGQVLYVAEQIHPQVHAGQHVKAGQTIGVYAGHGTGIESGLGSKTLGRPLTPYNGAPDGTETSGGKQARAFFEHLGAR